MNVFIAKCDGHGFLILAPDEAAAEQIIFSHIADGNEEIHLDTSTLHIELLLDDQENICDVSCFESQEAGGMFNFTANWAHK